MLLSLQKTGAARESIRRGFAPLHPIANTGKIELAHPTRQIMCALDFKKNAKFGSYSAIRPEPARRRRNS